MNEKCKYEALKKQNMFNQMLMKVVAGCLLRVDWETQSSQKYVIGKIVGNNLCLISSKRTSYINVNIVPGGGRGIPEFWLIYLVFV